MYESPPDAAAWQKFQKPLARTHDFRPEILHLHTSKERFRSRVKRDPITRCWVWDGPLIEGRPQIRTWDPVKGRFDQESAFVFLMSRWFPSSRITDESRIKRTCNVERCISPLHHQGYRYARRST